MTIASNMQCPGFSEEVVRALCLGVEPEKLDNGVLATPLFEEMIGPDLWVGCRGGGTRCGGPDAGGPGSS